MHEDRKKALKYLVLMYGLPKLLEDIEEVCSEFAEELRHKEPQTATAWDRAASSLRYALQTIDFSGKK